MLAQCAGLMLALAGSAFLILPARSTAQAPSADPVYAVQPTPSSPGLEGRSRAMDTLRVTVSEATGVSFDLTPDGRAIVFNILGLLWQVPIGGGVATRIGSDEPGTSHTQHPSVSPDGDALVAWSDRRGGRGVWLLPREGSGGRVIFERENLRFSTAIQLQPSWSPDGREVAWTTDSWNVRIHDIGTGAQRSVRSPELSNARFRSVTWAPDGLRLMVNLLNGALWEMDVSGESARRFTPPGVLARAPAYSPAGDELAYFTSTANGDVQLLVSRFGGEPRTITAGAGLENQRVRWTPDGGTLVFVRRGRLHQVPASGGTPREISFTAEINLPRERWPEPQITLRGPGDPLEARGFTGLALSPAGDRIAVIALGQIWAWSPGGEPRAVAPVPATATGLSWSSSGDEVVWSSGPGGAEDLHATHLSTGASRQVTRLPGGENHAAWSPDGEWVAFVHWAKPALGLDGWQRGGEPRVRVVRAADVPARDTVETVDLGELPVAYPDFHGLGYSSVPLLNWMPDSSSLLILGYPGWPVFDQGCAVGFRLPLDGSGPAAIDVPCGASSGQVTGTGTLVFLRDGVLNTAPLGETGWSAFVRVGDDAALLPTVARDGAVLYVTSSGLRLRSAHGEERLLGWPLKRQAERAPPSLLLRNVHIVDLEGISTSPESSDLLIDGGRIEEIAPSGYLARAATDTVDAEGRFAIPGMIDAHVHLWDEAVLRIALANGVTTARDMWAPLASSAALRDAIDYGVLSGPRLVLSGFAFYPGPTPRAVTSDQIWIAADSATLRRGLDLASAFGVGHVKVRLLNTSWTSGGDFVRQTRARGLPISGHCGHPVQLIAAGITGLEHLDGQCAEWTFVGADLPQIFRAAGISVTPTSSHFFARESIARERARFEASSLAGLLSPALRVGATNIRPDSIPPYLRFGGEAARQRSAVFRQAGARVVVGSDAPELPQAFPGEVESLVAVGFTPREALRAATVEGAHVLGVSDQVGAIRAGLFADLVLLDSDPLEDIGSIRQIWRVYKGGALQSR